jgi:hypothetical protein
LTEEEKKEDESLAGGISYHGNALHLFVPCFTYADMFGIILIASPPPNDGSVSLPLVRTSSSVNGSTGSTGVSNGGGSNSGGDELPAAKRRKKSVVWAPDDKLRNVRKFRTDDIIRPALRAIVATKFEATISWLPPPLAIYEPLEETKNFRRGSGSREASLQVEREKGRLATFYLARQQIPDTPADPDVIEPDYDDSLVPIVPWQLAVIIHFSFSWFSCPPVTIITAPMLPSFYVIIYLKTKQNFIILRHLLTISLQPTLVAFLLHIL